MLSIYGRIKLDSSESRMLGSHIYSLVQINGWVTYKSSMLITHTTTDKLLFIYSTTNKRKTHPVSSSQRHYRTLALEQKGENKGKLSLKCVCLGMDFCVVILLCFVFCLTTRVALGKDGGWWMVSRWESPIDIHRFVFHFRIFPVLPLQLHPGKLTTGTPKMEMDGR